MREVQKKNYCYSNDEYLSVFVGVASHRNCLINIWNRIMNY